MACETPGIYMKTTSNCEGCEGFDEILTEAEAALEGLRQSVLVRRLYLENNEGIEDLAFFEEAK